MKFVAVLLVNLYSVGNPERDYFHSIRAISSGKWKQQFPLRIRILDPVLALGYNLMTMFRNMEALVPGTRRAEIVRI